MKRKDKILMTLSHPQVEKFFAIGLGLLIEVVIFFLIMYLSALYWTSLSMAGLCFFMFTVLLTSLMISIYVISKLRQCIHREISKTFLF